MHIERSLVCVLIVGAAAPLAAAQDFGDRGDGMSVRSNSKASVSIAGFAGGDWNVINADGRVEVPISEYGNLQFMDIGKIQVNTTGQTDNVEAAWSEVILPNGRFIEFTYRTVNGLQFVPFGSSVDGSLIQAYTYEMGADGNGIDFLNWVSYVDWEELTISYSFDGGQTVFSDPTIFDPIGNESWNGTDDLHLGLAFPGDGVNWIRASYKIEAVPTPATLSLLVGGGVMALRRRR